MTDFTRNTSSMHFYDAMVIFEKRPHPMWTRMFVGDDALPYARDFNVPEPGWEERERDRASKAAS